MTIHLQNARILNPALGQDFIGDIVVRDGEIAAMGGALTPSPEAQCLDCTGLVAAPGLVDMHVHLRDPGLTEKEDIVTGCAAAAAGGITSLLCMPNTSPCTDTAKTVSYIIEKARTAKARVYVAAAISKALGSGAPTDYVALQKAGAIALTDDGRPVENTALLVKAMVTAPKLGMQVVAHCEDLYLAQNWYMHQGAVSKELGIAGVSAAAEDCGTAREIALAAVYKVPIHICHVSTSGAVALIRDAQKRGISVSGETAPHYLLLTDEALRKKDADYRMNPPLRSEEHRLAMIEAVKDGTIAVIATDHAPHTVAEKADFLAAPNGAIGMETSLAGAITALVEPGHITLSRLIALMSLNPARILGIEAGVLGVGKHADIVVFDPDAQWTVNPEALHGKSRNAVLKHMTLRGKVKYTLCRGEIVYMEGATKHGI